MAPTLIDLQCDGTEITGLGENQETFVEVQCDETQPPVTVDGVTNVFLEFPDGEEVNKKVTITAAGVTTIYEVGNNETWSNTGCPASTGSIVDVQPTNIVVEHGDPINFLGSCTAGTVIYQQETAPNVWTNTVPPATADHDLHDGTTWRMVCENEISSTFTIEVTCSPTVVLPDTLNLDPFTAVYGTLAACSITVQPTSVTGNLGDPVNFGGAVSSGAPSWWETFHNNTWVRILPPVEIQTTSDQTMWRLCCPDDCSQPVTITVNANSFNDNLTVTGGGPTENVTSASSTTSVFRTYQLANCPAGSDYVWQMRVQTADPVTAATLDPGDPAITGAWFDIPEWNGQPTRPLEVKIEEIINGNDFASLTRYTDLDATFYYEIRGSCANDGTFGPEESLTINYDHIDEDKI